MTEKRKKDRSGENGFGKSKNIWAILAVIVCLLGISTGAYARYSATYHADRDIALTVEPGTYTVVLHFGNGSTQPVETDSKDDDVYEFIYKLNEQITIPVVGDYFARKGHTGTGWNTNADGTGEEYKQGERASNLTEGGQTLNLYAMWSPNSYRIDYDANEGEGAPASETAYYGTMHTLSGQAPTREHYIFLGWYTEKDAGERVETVEIQDDIMLYAHWRLDTVKITYVPNMLPRGYTHVAWIGGDGASYIKTKTRLDDDSQVKVIYETSEEAAEGTSGIIGVNGDNGFCATIENEVISLSYGSLLSAAGIGAMYMDSPHLLPGGLGGSGKHELYANRNVWRIDGEEAAYFVYEPFETESEALIFGAAGLTEYFDGKIYGVRFADRSGTTAYMIPAVSGSGEPGLYDIKGGYFLSNAGTGEFVVGPERKYESEEVIRGENLSVISDPFEDFEYYMTSWNTESDGSGDSYYPGDEIPMQSNLTLYAIRSEKPVPTLKSGHLWYDSSVGGDESEYTSIRIIDEIAASEEDRADVVWNADVGDTGTIRCYKFGTELLISGNGSGSIRMAADPRDMFYEDASGDTSGSSAEIHAFSSVTDIEGLDLLDSSRCETLARLFCASRMNKTDAAEASSGGTGSANQGLSGADTSLTRLRGIEAWDVSRVKSLKEMCCGLEKIEEIADLSRWDTSNVTSLEFAFAGCKNPEKLNLENWDTSAVTSLCGAFYGCEMLGKLRVSSWDTSSVTDMSYAFYNMGCGADTFALDMTGWDIGKVSDMTAMFRGCDKLRTIYVSDVWKVAGQVMDTGMFSDCDVIVGEVGTSYDTAHVGSAYAHIDSADDPGYLTLAVAKTVAAGDLLVLTYGGSEYEPGDLYGRTQIDAVYDIPAAALTAADISWTEPEADIKKIKADRNIRFFKPNSLAYWFYKLTEATSFEGLENINTSCATSLEGTFAYTGENASMFVMDLSGWDVSKVTNFYDTFRRSGYSAEKWDVGNIGAWNMSSAENLTNMLRETGCLASTWNVGNIGLWDVSHVTSFSYFMSYANCRGTTWNLDLSAWNTSSATDMGHIFESTAVNAKAWSVGDLENWDVSHVKNMAEMFSRTGENAKIWSVGDISNWDTSSVTNMRGTFYYAGRRASAFELDLSGWDTGSVTSMQEMFKSAGYEARSVNLIGLSGWDVSNVTNMAYMFQNHGIRSTNYITMDLSGWDTSKVTSMKYMFERACKIKTIYVGDGWNTDAVTSSNHMFYSANAIVGGNGTAYDASHLTAEYARVDTADTPGYLTKAPVDTNNALLSVAAVSEESEDIQQKYMEKLFMYEDSLYDPASGTFTPATSPVTGKYYATKEEWLSSDEYASWKRDCEYLKSLLETG